MKRVFAGLFVAARCRFRPAGNAALHEEIRQQKFGLARWHVEYQDGFTAEAVVDFKRTARLRGERDDSDRLPRRLRGLLGIRRMSPWP